MRVGQEQRAQDQLWLALLCGSVTRLENMSFLMKSVGLCYEPESQATGWEGLWL